MSHSLSRLQAALLAIVILLALSLAGIGLFTVGSRQWLWRAHFHVHAGFQQIRGVEVGTRVRIQGIEAGEVENIQLPQQPGEEVILCLRLDGRLRQLVRQDGVVQILNEGMLGGKIVEIHPGSPNANPVEDYAKLASKPATELTDVLMQMNTALDGLRDSQGTVAKLLKDPEAYDRVLAVLQQTQQTLASFQQDADALKRLPVVRSYVEDPLVLLVRPNCERARQCFAATDLFEPGRAVLTDDGRRRLDELAPWLAGMKQKGSEVVVVAYADSHGPNLAVAQTITRQQSEAVCEYLKKYHKVHKLGWFSSRNVVPLGLGTLAPPIPEVDSLPADRIEVQVFIPQG
ncbi:MAG TPA: MlaD family protein [Gemmataceae bacterium]|nr:MlaD family protein [Gemmataceae bacterium]